jgi:lipoate-protein ligase A
MAIDLAMLRAAQQGRTGLRLYRWAPPCLSFGRNEPALSRYDRSRIAERGLATVRRPTGGRAVWHDHEVTYAVAAPCDRFGSLPEAYLAIHRMLGRALERLGIPVTLAARPGRVPGPGAGACFASPVGGEIVAAGGKLVGSAQVREGTAFLQHGSILLTDSQNVVTDVSTRRSLATGATSLATVLGRPVTFEEVADAIIVEARSTWNVHWSESHPEPAPADVARFADDAWTWRR